ncbi:hypothetical protein IEQ44_04135 [Nocardioides sp. Y6]|uniref:DUF2871 domain-containing protein n=1 Tax=Nocardioides malaquae TaxID=2773426 RepID=A0ABR9RRM6_9ACTN|nr:hypothetical protein [Nocardioides malaquae]MBE7323837.1 hypothetical protein [Nocardioides malaquae]
MYPPLTYAVAAYLALVAVLALVGLRRPSLDPVARQAMKIGHGATALVVALDAVKLLQGHEVANQVTHIGYMVAAVGLPVILLNQQRPEFDDEGNALRDEAGEPVMTPPPHLAVVAICAVAMVVLVVRLQQTL